MRCTLAVVTAAVAGLAGCGGHERVAATATTLAAAPPAPVVSVGRPTRPRFVAIGEHGGTLELVARPVRGAPGFRLALPHTPGANPRDLCVVTAAAGIGFTDGDRQCDVRTPGRAAAVASRPGVPDRLGAAPVVVAGIAPPDTVRVTLAGPGGRRVLPLSRHRAFLAPTRSASASSCAPTPRSSAGSGRPPSAPATVTSAACATTSSATRPTAGGSASRAAGGW